MKFRPEIAAMSGYQPGEQPPAGKFIKLNTNENPYRCSPSVRQAIEAVAAAGLSRYPDPLATSFRYRASEVIGVPPEWILCGNGSDDILTIVTRAFVGQSQCLRMPFPSYTLYQTLADIQGAVCERCVYDTSWALPPEYGTPRDDLRLAFLANPNSPSGTVVPPEIVQQLAQRLGCPLLVDEAYADFADQHCLPLVADNENVLVSRSLSKSYSLAGLRFGFVVAQPHVIEQLSKVKDSYNCDSIAIAAATAAIDDQGWRDKNRATIIASRERLQLRLAELGFDVQPSQANFVWCRHPSIPVKPIFEQLRAAKILIRYMSYDGWGDGLRITVGTDGQIDACLKHLAELLNT